MKMYNAIANSPTTALIVAVSANDTTLQLLDASKLPDAPNLATIGKGDSAETILYAGKEGNNLTGVTRGFEGAAKEWGVNAPVARFFTAYDHRAFKGNIETVQSDLGDKTLLTTIEKTNIVGAVNEVKDGTTQHLEKNVSQGEIHGLRVTDGVLEYFDGAIWKAVSSGGGSGIPVGNVVNFQAKEGNASVALTWQDPADLVLDGITLAKWQGTKILRKTGSYPVNENDGVLVVDSGVRDQYATNGFIDSGLTNEITYYYSAFPYTDENAFDAKADVQATPVSFKIYGVRIDKANSNPNTSVTRTDDAVGMSVSDFDNVYPFNELKPCLFKNGQVNYYLNPNDFTKKTDGSNADITSGNDGDVMIEFPKVWWKITSNTSYVDVKFATAQIDSTYKPLAHTKGTTEKDKIYIGAYLGYSDGTKLRSLSSKTPTVNQTIGAFRTLTQANGAGYQQIGYYQLLMLQVLYLVRYKSLDSQTALGRGYVDGNASATSTGGANIKGMNFGEATGKQQMKFCGIEDFWGNCYYFIDGLFSDASYNILIGTENFNDTGSGYTNFGQGATANISGYMSDIQGGTETGFITKASSGSETTYYCDYASLSAGLLPAFGGYGAYASYAGAFRLDVSRTADYSSSYASARACFV